MALTLIYNASATVPLELPDVIPENFVDKSIDEIGSSKIFHGNREVTLADFFQMEGSAEDETIIFEGDLSGVHWVGAKMSRGEIIVRGDCGRHVGSEMNGGSIRVEGNTGDWLGAELQKGAIEVTGNAGHLVGAAYRGSVRGMTGGLIMVHGNAGNEIGHSMRRGMIAIGGNAGDLIGFNMLAGSILVFGNVGIRHGAGMRRGTIGLLGNEPIDMLPTFRYACRIEPTVTHLMLAELNQRNFSAAKQIDSMPVDLYNGDLLEGGRGEVLIRAHNSQGA